jgi:hypothetical protein
MSDSPVSPIRRGITWNVIPDPTGLLLPHRVTNERREEAEALVVAAADWTPSWAAQPTLDLGSGFPPEDEAA